MSSHAVTVSGRRIQGASITASSRYCIEAS